LAVVNGPDTEALGELSRPGQYYQSPVAATVPGLLGLDFSGKGKAAAPLPMYVK